MTKKTESLEDRGKLEALVDEWYFIDLKEKYPRLYSTVVAMLYDQQLKLDAANEQIKELVECVEYFDLQNKCGEYGFSKATECLEKINKQ